MSTKPDQRVNWNALRTQPCGGLYSCNCFLGTDFGYDPNIPANEANWQALCSWMREQHAPTEMLAHELKAWVNHFKQKNNARSA